LVKTVVNPLKGKVSMKRFPNGILFSGPAGTGKTFLAEALAGEANMSFMVGNINAIFGRYVGESEANIDEFVRVAVANAPALIFFDELDAMGLSRESGGDSGVGSRVFNKLLQAMGQATGVVWIGATNRPLSIDAAMLRRFSKSAPVLLQTGEELKVAVGNCMRRNEYPPCAFDVSLFEGYTGDEIQNVVIKAAELLEDYDTTPEHALTEALGRIRRATQDVVSMTKEALEIVKDTDWMPDSYWLPQEAAAAPVTGGGRLSNNWDGLEI